MNEMIAKYVFGNINFVELWDYLPWEDVKRSIVHGNISLHHNESCYRVTNFEKWRKDIKIRGHTESKKPKPNPLIPYSFQEFRPKFAYLAVEFEEKFWVESGDIVTRAINDERPKDCYSQISEIRISFRNSIKIANILHSLDLEQLKGL